MKFKKIFILYDIIFMILYLETKYKIYVKKDFINKKII